MTDQLHLEELVEDLFLDSAERREVLDAIEAVANSEVMQDHVDTLMSHGEELLNTGDRMMVTVLAAVGYEPAVVLLMFGG